jgi:hypothetical protein
MVSVIFKFLQMFVELIYTNSKSEDSLLTGYFK